MCDPSLREEGRLWCGEHDRYEDRCWLCHPELRDPSRAYCETHGLYQDECHLCRPEVAGASRATRVSDSGTLICGEHRVAEAECGICRPQVLQGLKAGEGLKVRLPTPESARLAGLATGAVKEDVVREEIPCVGELRFAPDRFVRVATPVEAIVRELLVDYGDRVKTDQGLVRLWSASMEEAVVQAVLSYRKLVRERGLLAVRVTSEQAVEEAEAAYRAASQRARNYGFSESDIRARADREEGPVYLELKAPFAGEVLEVNVGPGTRVAAGEPLVTVVDASVLRAWLYVPEEAASRLRGGEPVEVWSGGRAPHRVTGRGRVMWISPQLDERTRLVRVLAEVDNGAGRLRAGMFVEGTIVAGQREGLRLPESALLRVEGRPVVFIGLAPDLFEARVVELGARGDGWWEVRAGLKPGEPVVVEGGFLLKSSLLSSRLGQACVDE
ncbi:efflux RND transporter periplasmic adaptor subunit [Limisphaera sp. 4302-co]|uniref:efflux RND transporter periplasmic adaptor subunit n=1 Tax=Limisphaera sp. 4302-co TaxID=3400417 RepID=UPI003C172F47